MGYLELKDNTKKYILYLKRGEKINEGIEAFCKKNCIKNASFTGIGAITKVEVAQYQIEKKAYHHKIFDGNYELISLVGNFGYIRNNTNDDKYFAHTHISFTDTDFTCRGGHLIEAEVCAVAEIYLTAYGNALIRKYDENIGLNTMLLRCDCGCSENVECCASAESGSAEQSCCRNKDSENGECCASAESGSEEQCCRNKT